MKKSLKSVWVAAVCALSVVFAAGAHASAPSAPANVARSFKGLIRQVDAAGKTVTVEDRLTGFAVTIAVDPDTQMTLTRQVEIDNLPDGQWVVVSSPAVDPAAKTIKGIDKIDLLSAPPAATDRASLVKQFAVTGKLTRKGGDFSQYKGKALLTAKRDAGYELLAGNETWRLETEDDLRWCRRPNAFVTQKDQKGTIADLRAGQDIEVHYAETAGRCVMERCQVSDLFPGFFPYYINKPAGPSGLTLADLQKKMAAVQSAYAKAEKDLARLMPVKMKVTPELALAGEKVTLELEVVADREPNPTLISYPEYLKTEMKVQKKLPLTWKVSGKKDGRNVYTAKLKLPADQKGQHMVYWSCDIGGDLKDFWRSYAVIDQTYAVCILNVLSAPIAPFHQAHVPVNTWELKPLELDNWKDSPYGESWASASRDYRCYGDNPGYYPLYAPWNSYQIREESPEMQRFVLASLRKMATRIGFTGEADNFGEYTMGTQTVQIARELGFKTVHSLCTEHHMDGVFGFNNFGKPERPYFISREDFRKTGDGGKNGMVGFPQLDRHIELARTPSNAYNPEGACMEILDSTNVQLTKDPKIFMSHVMDHLEGNFQNRLSQRVPYFLSFDFQFSGDPAHARLRACDQLMLDYFVKQARTNPVALSTAAGVSDYYRRHYTITPETTSYYHDYYAGMTVYGKPHEFPDVMAIENDKFMAILVADAILPDSLYDHTVRWNYPDWGNENIPRARNPLGDFQRGLHDKFAVTPKIVDTRGMSASRQDVEADGQLKLVLTVKSDRDKKNLPLALWNIPRQWQSGEGWWKVKGTGRFVPVRAPYTGNLNGLLVTDVKKGVNTITLLIKTPPRKPETLDFPVGPLAKGKFFEREGQLVAYVWPAYPWETELTIDLPAGKAVQCYISPKIERVDCKPGKNTFRIPAGESMRVIGLSQDELPRFCHTSGPLPLSGSALSN